MQNRECVIFERTRNTDERIHKPCAWSRAYPVFNQSSGGYSFVPHAVADAIARWNFLLSTAKKKQCRLWLLSKIIWKASSVQHKILFSLKYRTNINLYVEYSRTWIRDFWRILSWLIRTLNFTQNDICQEPIMGSCMCATSNKNTNFNISKNLLCKVEISNSFCSRTV